MIINASNTLQQSHQIMKKKERIRKKYKRLRLLLTNNYPSGKDD